MGNIGLIVDIKKISIWHIYTIYDFNNQYLVYHFSQDPTQFQKWKRQDLVRYRLLGGLTTNWLFNGGGKIAVDLE